MVVPRTKMSALSESDRCAPVASVAPLPQHVQSRDYLFLVSGTPLMNCIVIQPILKLLPSNFGTDWKTFSVNKNRNMVLFVLSMTSL